jgi:4-hydroxymandelate oxidase
MEPINLDELEAVARERLPQMAYDYYASGALDERTLADNRAAWARWRLHYRVLVDVSTRDTGAQLLGHPIAAPIAVAPTAFHKLAHPEGEVATARAAGAAGTWMFLSTLSTTRVEEVCEAATGPVGFQLYVYKDRGVTRDLIARAEAAGCRALVLTADAPLIGTRERDVRNRFHLPDGLRMENLLPAGMDAVAEAAGDSGLAAYVARLLESALTWDLVDWLAGVTRLPILIKGVVRADDAVRALDHGAAGIWVSNHGGRQLDDAPATATVLPEVAEAVAGRAPVLVDGGLRRGADVLKAVALGATAVCVGRPILWGLAAGGQAGAERALGMLREELSLAMALAGCPSLRDLPEGLVRHG